MVEVKNISKRFVDIQAVKDLSFEIGESEIVGLLGPNGAGKSTTMRIVSGYLSPDEGEVLLEGISVDSDPIAAQRLIGYLPENNPLYNSMLVSEILEYSANLKGISKADLKEALDFAVSSVNISDVYYRPVGELSKGFKQRVGLALALVHKPKILILDEPTEGLDPNQRTEIRKLIKDLSKEHTVVISTHVMQEVEALCSRVIIINEGEKVADGSVDELATLSRNEKTISVKLEGKKIEESLAKIKNVDKFNIKNLEKNIVQATFTTNLKTFVQPELSKMAAKNNWIVWELIEEKQQLEDIFKKLTEKREN